MSSKLIVIEVALSIVGLIPTSPPPNLKLLNPPCLQTTFHLTFSTSYDSLQWLQGMAYTAASTHHFLPASILFFFPITNPKLPIPIPQAPSQPSIFPSSYQSATSRISIRIPKLTPFPQKTTGQSRCFPFWQDLLACYVVNTTADDVSGGKKCLPALDDYYECLHHKKEVRPSTLIGKKTQPSAASIPPIPLSQRASISTRHLDSRPPGSQRPSRKST